MLIYFSNLEQPYPIVILDHILLDDVVVLS